MCESKTRAELIALMKNVQGLFDIIRVVDPHTTNVLKLEGD